MSPGGTLHHLLEESARKTPESRAVEEEGPFAVTYGELNALSDRVRDRLRLLGVGPGDRVGLCLRKSIDSVASLFGILKAGAAYVPTDPGAPAARNAYIMSDCAVRAVILEERFREGLGQSLGHDPHLLVVGPVTGGRALAEALDRMDASDPAPSAPSTDSSPDDLAYILYTSGSTGLPKGVMLTHRNALSFVNWASEAFEPTPADRFSSHAPFHFDLSVLDLYLSLKHGATLVLIGEETGKDPHRLAPLLAGKGLTIWYSTPSILSLLAQYGRLNTQDLSAIRIVLFAGEIFPVRHLRALKALLPAPRYFNLYGPTETNVCTFYEIPARIPADRAVPFPIGRTCSHLKSRVTDEQGREVPRGQSGELCISGPAVTEGYWNLPQRNAEAFWRDPDGTTWYRTGDMVVEQEDGDFTFLGRRDRMVKRRGYRVELGEIEAGLYRHPGIREAAVTALSDEEGVRIKAFVSFRDGHKPGIIDLKRFCAENLPAYMIPDAFSVQDTLPKTSTDKIDYQRLRGIE